MRIKKQFMVGMIALALVGAGLHGLAADQAGKPLAQTGSVPPAAQPTTPLDGQDIGRVIRFAPEGLTRRAGVLGENFLHLGELIEQGEQIETGLDGRAEIQLFDGSALNLGPSSTLRIVAYDARSHQIRLALPAGSMSTESLQPASQGSRFQVETPTAVVDGAGSIVVYDPPRFTDICEVDGAATVRNANPAVSGAVPIHSGECTRVVLNRAPVPLKKSPDTIRSEARLSRVSDLPNDNTVFSRSKP